MATDPHGGQPIVLAGTPLTAARQALLLVHGRGASAEDILSLAVGLGTTDTAFLAPQAAENSWYPQRFLVPSSANQPWLASALALLEVTLGKILSAGIPPERIFLLGFSQGACLALELAARHARRYGGLIGLSGALIGAEDEPRQDEGDFSGAPVFLGCADPDPHIPRARVVHTAQVLEGMGAQVTTRFYPGAGHAILADEILFIRHMISPTR